MLLRCLLPCLLSASALAAPPSAAPAVPVEREFRDWVVTCDNLRHCVAEGADTDDPSLVLRFLRDAGPAGEARMEIHGADPGALTGRMHLDEQALIIGNEHWQQGQGDDDDAWHCDDAGTIAKFIDAIRNGKRVSIDDAGASLDGLVAALLFVDEVQQRSGGETAWIRRGARLASAVPPAPKAPGLRPAPYRGVELDSKTTQALIAAASELAQAPDSDCDLEDDDEPEKLAFRLNDSEALVLLECGRGAYQSGYRAYRGPIAQPAKLRMISLPALPGEHREDWLMSAGYDPKTAHLSQFAKGRGLGDCGDSDEWLFDGRDFLLVAATRQTRCQGVMLDFPSLWRNE